MKKFIYLALFLIFSFHLYSEKFQFKYIPGSKQKIEANINGKQYQNDQFLLDYSQYYKTIRTVKDFKGNTASIEESNYFYNQNKFLNQQILELNDYATVNYTKELFGYIKTIDNLFFPTLRNVPVFPDKDIEPGFEWVSKGAEVQDLFGDSTFSEFPLEVKYKFLGYENVNNKKLAKFKYEHNIDVTNTGMYKIDPRIKRVVGTSETILFFDNETGSQVREEYSRDYAFLLRGLKGDYVAAFVDSGERNWEPIELMDKDKIVDDINKKLKDDKIEDTNVTKDDKGIKIQLENLHFYPDSSELLPEEKARLDKIAGILKNYKGRGVMVIGHTALAGTAEARKKLSLERAKIIIDYLEQKDAINTSKSSFGGKGAEEPIADNNTEEGKKKNRRAEIYILEE